jgi:hypothetical protein
MELAFPSNEQRACRICAHLLPPWTIWGVLEGAVARAPLSSVSVLRDQSVCRRQGVVGEVRTLLLRDEGGRLALASGLDDKRSSAPVLTFHLLFGKSGRVLPIRAQVFAQVLEGARQRGVWLWAGVSVLARSWWRSWRVNTSCRLELIVRRSSSDEARWASATHSGVWLVVMPDNISWPARGPNVDPTIRSTIRSRGGLRAKSTCK